jgi:hypothetical protein
VLLIISAYQSARRGGRKCLNVPVSRSLIQENQAKSLRAANQFSSPGVRVLSILA